MQQDSVVIRSADKSYEEGLAFARYVDMASEGGFHKALGPRFEDVIATAFMVPNHDLTYAHTVFAERDGVIVGMVSGYTAEEHRASSDLPLKLAPGSRIRRMVGLLLLRFISRILGELDEQSYYIQFLAVDENARGRGIGTELLTYLENRAQSHGCRRFCIDVSAKNPGARRLYSRHGFEIASEWPKIPLLPRVVYRMDKVI